MDRKYPSTGLFHMLRLLVLLGVAAPLAQRAAAGGNASKNPPPPQPGPACQLQAAPRPQNSGLNGNNSSFIPAPQPRSIFNFSFSLPSIFSIQTRTANSTPQTAFTPKPAAPPPAPGPYCPAPPSAPAPYQPQASSIFATSSPRYPASGGHTDYPPPAAYAPTSTAATYGTTTSTPNVATSYSYSPPPPAIIPQQFQPAAPVNATTANSTPAVLSKPTVIRGSYQYSAPPSAPPPPLNASASSPKGGTGLASSIQSSVPAYGASSTTAGGPNYPLPSGPFCPTPAALAAWSTHVIQLKPPPLGTTKGTGECTDYAYPRFEAAAGISHSNRIQDFSGTGPEAFKQAAKNWVTLPPEYANVPLPNGTLAVYDDSAYKNGALVWQGLGHVAAVDGSKNNQIIISEQNWPHPDNPTDLSVEAVPLVSSRRGAGWSAVQANPENNMTPDDLERVNASGVKHVYNLTGFILPVRK